MPNIADILQQAGKKSLFLSILVFMNNWIFMLSWVEHEKSFINLGSSLVSTKEDSITY